MVKSRYHLDHHATGLPCSAPPPKDELTSPPAARPSGTGEIRRADWAEQSDRSVMGRPRDLFLAVAQGFSGAAAPCAIPLALAPFHFQCGGPPGA